MMRGVPAITAKVSRYKNSSIPLFISRLRFWCCGERWGGFGDRLRRELDREVRHFEKIERLAVGRQLELAPHQPALLKLLQMEMEQWPADADFAGQLADIGPAVGGKGRHDAQTERVGECGNHREQLVPSGPQQRSPSRVSII